MKYYYTYILASRKHGTLYTGITSDLQKRIWQHKNKVKEDSFSAQHNVTNLVHFECFDDPANAIHREKRLKKYNRDAKIKLIETKNPDWNDLYETICA